MARRIMVSTLVALLVAAVPAKKVTDPAPSKTIIVKMVEKSLTEFAFEPANITARRGDVIRFVQTSTSPHNVEFTNTPDGTELNGSGMGPYLTQIDETYDVVIDGRFVPGEHTFVCTPHEFMGMVGMITVEN